MNHKAIASADDNRGCDGLFLSEKQSIITPDVHNNLQINNIYLVCFFRKIGYNHNECSKGSRTAGIEFTNLDIIF